MMEMEQRMLKGFVTAASLSSEDIDAVDRSVRETWFPDLVRDIKKANALNMRLSQYALKKKAQLAALGEWTHINGLRRASRARVQDKILQSLMYEFDPGQPQESRSDALSSIDSTSITEIPVDQVPGGTISFIFEKFSTTIEKGDDSEPGDEDSS